MADDEEKRRNRRAKQGLTEEQVRARACPLCAPRARAAHGRLLLSVLMTSMPLVPWWVGV